MECIFYLTLALKLMPCHSRIYGGYFSSLYHFNCTIILFSCFQAKAMGRFHQRYNFWNSRYIYEGYTLCLIKDNVRKNIDDNKIQVENKLKRCKILVDNYTHRTSSGQEIDFILEGPENHIIGIEVKSKRKVTKKDFLHLETLQHDLGKKFMRGFVFYQGIDIVPFGKNLWAIPIIIL